MVRETIDRSTVVQYGSILFLVSSECRRRTVVSLIRRDDDACSVQFGNKNRESERVSQRVSLRSPHNIADLCVPVDG